MDSHQAVGKIFNNLTVWRNLPKYQLERRADIFFSLYLKEVLEAKLSEHGESVELLPHIIPEFPLKQKDKNHTVNVDYVMFSKDTVYLIEFKTDMGSFRDKQYEYLVDAMVKIKKTGLKTILNEIKDVFKATDDKQKYFYLFNIFEELALVKKLPPELHEKIFPVSTSTARGVSDAIDKIEIICSIERVFIIFLQPEHSIDQKRKFRKLLKNRGFENRGEVKFITFTDVIKQISKSEDPFSRLFSDYIGMWIKKAGSTSREAVLEQVEELSFLHRTKIPTKPPTHPVHLPAHIGDLLHQLREEQGISLDLSVTPLEDPETFELIRSGDTDNVPMLDSKIVQEHLVMFKPKTIEELATAMAITTGGVIWSGGTQEFIERHHGRKKVEYDLPDLEPILKNTFGIIVYAEQVIKIAEIIAGFSGTERTTLSFHLNENMQGRPFKVSIMQHKDRFLAGAKQKGYPDEIIENLFSKISKFSRFDFYDACYAEDHALAAYRCAYLKAHYPDEYNAMFGIYSQPHPLTGYTQLISQKTNATTATLDSLQSDSAVRICGYIENFKKMALKNGGVVGLGVLEDQYGFVEILIPQHVLTQHESNLQSRKPVVISGVLKRTDKTDRIIVAGVEYASEAISNTTVI